ncbi:hypothetical protein, partial [Streptomyces spongiae]|uniref:hypothetical protein n=1 Tax=Streptomyces spongiae TaxID=565072 RepID=UPI001884356B
MHLTERGGLGEGTDVPEAPEPRTRLLPWTGAFGQPCYLIEDGTGDGTLSRIADRVETLQLGLAEQLHEQAWELLATHDAPDQRVRHLAEQLAQALGDTLLIAESRGARLGQPTESPPAPPAARTHGLRGQVRLTGPRLGGDLGHPLQQPPRELRRALTSYALPVRGREGEAEASGGRALQGVG